MTKYAGELKNSPYESQKWIKHKDIIICYLKYETCHTMTHYVKTILPSSSHKNFGRP